MLEYCFLLIKHKAYIGGCKILEGLVDIESEAILHREEACRMTPDKTSKAIQEVHHFAGIRDNSPFIVSMGKWNANGHKKSWRGAIML